MYRPILTCAFVLVGTVAFAQQPATQQPAQSDPYQGQSSPPADDIIVTAPQDQPQVSEKPHPGKPMVQPTPAPAETAVQPPAPRSESQPEPQNAGDSQFASQPISRNSSENAADTDVTGTDDGVVGIAKEDPREATAGTEPALRTRGESGDPDGDIVNPHPLAPGELADGTTIRVHLLTRLSTVDSQAGELFRTQVASDVLQDGQVLIPAGAEIDGRVVQVESGTARSHGTMLLRPETVILGDGSRFKLDAQVSGAPGTGTRVNGEGYVAPGSRYKRDGMEYGGGVGAGVVTGALIGGPVGAVVGGLIGGGAITLHVVTKHSDATLDPGAVLMFTLDSRLNLQTAANATAN